MATATHEVTENEARARPPHDAVVVRFAGDSGDGMQLTGGQFTLSTALAGNDLATFILDVHVDHNMWIAPIHSGHSTLQCHALLHVISGASSVMREQGSGKYQDAGKQSEKCE